jgi:membrane-bound inhibitor of C-type lysozyme
MRERLAEMRGKRAACRRRTLERNRMIQNSLRRRAFWLFLALSGLGLPTLAGADEPGTPVVPPAGEKIIEAIYHCESGATVTVRYDNSDPASPRARLDYKGRTFDMYSVVSASGARYATEQGLEPDKGLQWWSKGNEATLSEMIMDHTAPEPTVIETCTAAPGK